MPQPALQLLSRRNDRGAEATEVEGEREGAATAQGENERMGDKRERLVSESFIEQREGHWPSEVILP